MIKLQASDSHTHRVNVSLRVSIQSDLCENDEIYVMSLNLSASTDPMWLLSFKPLMAQERMKETFIHLSNAIYLKSFNLKEKGTLVHSMKV